MIGCIDSKIDFIESLRGKEASFLLSLSNTATAEIEGITQAGIAKMLHLTPTLDSEFISVGEVRSLESIATTPTGVPTPALITRAIHLLKPFREISFLDLGLRVKPKVDYFKLHSFDIAPSGSIAEGADIDAEAIFQKGLYFGKTYQPEGDYVILAESVPSGTTTASATALALGYDAKDMFSSSFRDVPNFIREQTIEKALSHIEPEDDIFDRLSKVSDNMLIFNAGFILGLNGRVPLVLAGGTQMACLLLVVNKILELMNGELDSSNLALCTTKWVYEDRNSDIEALLKLLKFPINAYYSQFDFSLSENALLKLYDSGEAKEGVGAGASLVYGVLKGLDKKSITESVERFFENSLLWRAEEW
jgi:uncharacterized protein (TIGR00303 family)